MEENKVLTSREVMEHIVRALDSKKARDITVLYTEQVSVLTEYFIICTAGSTAQIKTLSDETAKALAEAGEPLPRTEGYRAGGWVLLDFGCAVVHIFLKEAREFYDLERLWSDAPRMDISALLTE